MTPASTLSLPIATGLSIALHMAALISWPQPPGQGGAHATARPPLDVRFARSEHPAAARPLPAPSPDAQRITIPPPTAPRSAPDPARRPAIPEPAALPPPEAPESPLPVFPIEALSRLPTLVTEVSPEEWPSTPGAPSGSFMIEVDVGPDGRVMRVNPVCEPAMCEAAAIYSGAVVGWRFTPAEILGHRVTSRIHVEFEIGSPESAGFSATPVTPSRPTAPVVRPAETPP